MNSADSIFALSSGAPPAAIAVIRLSGPAAFAVGTVLAGELPPLRQAGLRILRDPSTGAELDQALVLCFGAGRSFTGEDLVELHCHGGQAVVAAIMRVIGEQASMRPAQPGEFTRRALEAGQLDLNEVEGLADLLRAETEAQRVAAMAMYGGAFTARVDAFRRQALTVAGRIEALLDFSDEDDVASAGSEDAVRQALSALAEAITTELSAPPVERLRDGIRVVIAGPVNSGKSTLLNRLAGRDAAIVSDVEGTTRDRIEVPVSIGGVAYVLTDTAGFRDQSEDTIERIGMDRAREAIEGADILLWLGVPAEAPRNDAVLVTPRIDRLDVVADPQADVALSAVTGAGMDCLMALLAERADGLLRTEAAYLLSARQRSGLTEAVEALMEARGAGDLLIAAEHVRTALTAFDRLTGRAATEDMLDSLFSGFCIGK